MSAPGDSNDLELLAPHRFIDNNQELQARRIVLDFPDGAVN